MLAQELTRILKGTLFVKNEPHIISISSSSYRARNLDSLVSIISQNLKEKDKGDVFESSDCQDFSENFEKSLKSIQSQAILFGDLSFELEFGYFSQGISKINDFKNLSSENQKLSKFNNLMNRDNICQFL